MVKKKFATWPTDQYSVGHSVPNGETLLIAGAKILNKTTYGPNGKVDLEIAAKPQKVVNFYEQTMNKRGGNP